MRFQSVSSVVDFFEVVFFLILRRLPNRYDPDYIVRLGVRNSHYLLFEQAQRKQPRLAVIKALIQKSYGRARKDFFNRDKVKSMAPKIRSPLSLVPFKPRKQCNYKL